MKGSRRGVEKTVVEDLEGAPGWMGLPLPTWAQ